MVSQAPPLTVLSPHMSTAAATAVKADVGTETESYFPFNFLYWQILLNNKHVSILFTLSLLISKAVTLLLFTCQSDSESDWQSVCGLNFSVSGNLTDNVSSWMSVCLSDCPLSCSQLSVLQVHMLSTFKHYLGSQIFIYKSYSNVVSSSVVCPLSVAA